MNPFSIAEDRALWSQDEYNWAISAIRDERDEIHNAALRVYSVLNGSIYSAYQPVDISGSNVAAEPDDTPFYYDVNPPTNQTYIKARTKGMVCAGFTNIVLRESGVEIYGAHTKVPGGVPDSIEALELGFKHTLLTDDIDYPVRDGTGRPVPTGSFICAPFLDMYHQGHLAILIEDDCKQYILSCLPAWSDTVDYLNKGTLYRATARKHIDLYGNRVKYSLYCPPSSIKNWKCTML